MPGVILSGVRRFEQLNQDGSVGIGGRTLNLRY